MGQTVRHTMSAERNPQDLVAEARRYGFAAEHIRVVEDDMGIGAYSTRIEDRPGLSRWLFEALPRGESLVVLTSHEDRLFRDRDETEHNRFIAQAAKYGGWAICGPNVYNLRRKFDQDRFRWVCKANKEFIEGHIKGRLHPAIQRAAMQGQYTGGPVSWGYVVDYNAQSSTYKHLKVYEPHSVLVVEQVFRYFASLPQPSQMAVAYHWEREGLVWPFYSAEVDARVVRVSDACRKRDEARSGYLFDYRQVPRILTDVNYLGWRVRAGEIAWDAVANAPRMCHPPLVDADLFWWCHDRIGAERPAWAPPPAPRVHPVARARRPRGLEPAEQRLLAPGRVRCVVHERPFTLRRATDGRALLECNGGSDLVYHASGCPTPHGPHIDAALLRAFLDQLVLDEQDVAEIARLFNERSRMRGREETLIRQEIAERKQLRQRAMEWALREDNATLVEELRAQAREHQRVIEEREREMVALIAVQVPSSQAWSVAQRASQLAERIRATFLEWSRQAQARVISLALDDSLVGYVDRRVLGFWMRWHGGSESRAEIMPTYGRHVPWTEREIAALRQFYPLLTWNALQRMLPGRTRGAIKRLASRHGWERPDGVSFLDSCPFVAPTPAVPNTMEKYGFPLVKGGDSAYSVSARGLPPGRRDTSPLRRWSAATHRARTARCARRRAGGPATAPEFPPDGL